MARQPGLAGQSTPRLDSKAARAPSSKRSSRSASLNSIAGVDRSSSSTTSSSADSASHTDGSVGQSDKMSEHQTVLLDEIHRLTTENASLQHKLETGVAVVMAPPTPEAKENGPAQTGLREQNKTLANENSRLQEQVAQLERRILTGTAYSPSISLCPSLSIHHHSPGARDASAALGGAGNGHACFSMQAEPFIICWFQLPLARTISMHSLKVCLGFG